MTIIHSISEDEQLSSRIHSRMTDAKEAIFATAFFTLSAYKEIEQSLISTLERGAKVFFIIGRYDYITDPKAVKKLIALQKKHAKNLFVYFDPDYYFHYKAYLFKKKGSSALIVGSSNLTSKGLSSQGEINLEIFKYDKSFNEVRRQLLKRIEGAKTASDEIEEYEKKYNYAKKFRQMRTRWHNKGKLSWTKKNKRAKSTKYYPTEKKYDYCHIDRYAKDKTLEKNIEREAGYYNFSNQGAIGCDAVMKRIKVGRVFIVNDELLKKIGFATCISRFTALDSYNHKQIVIYYRFINGLSMRLKNISNHKKTIVKMKLRTTGDKISGKSLATFKKVLKIKGA